MARDNGDPAQPASQDGRRHAGTPEIDYVSDIQNMLEYCRSNGIPVSSADDAAPRGVAFADSGPSPAPRLGAALHGQLSALIRPVTPRTLAATEFSRDPLRLGSAVLLVIALAATALAAVIGYSATLAGATNQTGTLIVQLNYLFAALLGAAFSALFTASPYVRDRTFDPRYVLVYIMRLVLGVIAGLILANLGSGLFTSETLIAKLGTGMIGLLGGYSAEAVRSVLDRLVEVLVAAVHGEDQSKAQRLELSGDIIDISRAAAADPNTPADVRDKLEQLLKKLQKR
jgi:hypothetical protein